MGKRLVHPSLRVVPRAPARGADGSAPAPADLSADAQKMWRELCAERGLRDPGDLLVLTTACRAFDSMRAAQAIVDAEGTVILNARGASVRNPACHEVDVCRAGMLRCLRQLPAPRPRP